MRIRLLLLFIELSAYAFCRADNLPEFMQNLGFVSDSSVPETYSFSNQIEPFLLAQTQQFPSASQPLGMSGTPKG